MKRFRKYLSWSNLAITLILYVIISQILSLKYYEDPHRIIRSDVSNYYAYLPLTFIYDQIDYRLDETSLPIAKAYKMYSIGVENGNNINPYTMGMAIAYSPFFFAVHLPMKWLNYPTTGFSQPYRISILLACLFYVITALFLLKKMLLKIFNDKATAISITALVLATNLLYYIIYEPGMPHAFNFAFGVYFLYLTIKWHENPGVSNSIGLGLLSGLISLIRPTDLVIAIVFILWKVDSFNSLRRNVMLFLQKWYLILIILIFAFLVWVPQMLYWEHYTGYYLYNPYKDLGFKFFFNNPQVLISLFSYRKGWLLYTPVMLLLIPGFIYLYRKYREYFWPVLIYFLINFWIISAWCLPWYGGSYGHRAFVASYSIMAIPLAAAFLSMFSKRKIPGFVIGALISGLFIAHNLFQLQQYRYGAIHYVSMTKEAYWDSFMRKRPSPRFKYLLSYPDYNSAKEGKYPKPVIDPRYTGKLTRDEIQQLIQQEIAAELKNDSIKNLEMINRAQTEGISYEELIKQQATRQMEEQIKENIIIPKQ